MQRLSPQKREFFIGMSSIINYGARRDGEPTFESKCDPWKYSIHLCSYVVNELSINSTKRVEDGDVGRKIVFRSVTQIREVGEAVICILRP